MGNAKTTQMTYYPPDEDDILGITFKPGSVGTFTVAYNYRVPSPENPERGIAFMQARSEVTVERCGSKKFSTVLGEIVESIAEQEPKFSEEVDSG